MNIRDIFHLGAKLNFNVSVVQKLGLSVSDRTFEIDACGNAELANGTTLLRFYSSGNEYVQMIIEGSQIIDAKFFVTQQVLGVETLKVFDEYIAKGGSLRQAHFDFGGVIWERCWGDLSEECEPAQIQEKVAYGAPQFPEQYEVYHSFQLYHRNENDDTIEKYLLVAAEDAKHGYELSFSIGVDIEITELFEL